MAVTINGTTGITTPALDNQGNLTVDTNTLVVDSVNNRVGVGTASPTQNLDVTATGASTAIILAQNTTATSGGAALRASNPQNLFIMGTDDNGGGLSGHANSSYFYTTSASPIVFMPNATERMKIDSAGRVTMPYQPAFLAIPTGSQFNFPINAQTTVDFANEIFDQGNNFSSNTFTAPVSGRYQFSVMLYANNMDTATDYYQCQLMTSNRTYSQIVSSNRYTADLTYYSFAVSILADMDAEDTAYVRIDVSNSGTGQLDLEGTASRFSGYLVA